VNYEKDSFTLERVMFPVLHLDLLPTAAIEPIAMLRHQTFKTELTRLAK
jgi:hypothetical protein